MKNSRWIICFDFETDSPNQDTCNPVQLAAVPIDPVTLEVKKDQSFNVTIKPEGINKKDYFTPEREKTINWHAQIHETSYEDITLPGEEIYRFRHLNREERSGAMEFYYRLFSFCIRKRS